MLTESMSPFPGGWLCVLCATANKTRYCLSLTVSGFVQVSPNIYPDQIIQDRLPMRPDEIFRVNSMMMLFYRHYVKLYVWWKVILELFRGLKLDIIGYIYTTMNCFLVVYTICRCHLSKIRINEQIFIWWILSDVFKQRLKSAFICSVLLLDLQIPIKKTLYPCIVGHSVSRINISPICFFAKPIKALIYTLFQDII